jgi:alpha-L-rhamnosidase
MKLIFPGASTKNAIVSAIILLLMSGCGKSHNQSEKIEISDLHQAVWITDGRVWPIADSLMYGDFPAPLFRREITVKSNVKSATLFITAAGYYQAYINGKPVGRNILDPAWTNYSKRIYYSEYDLTADLHTGKNCLGTTLGNGFYNPLPMKMWSSLNLRNFLPVGKPAFIAKLKIVYNDGKVEDINTNSSWRYSYGPVIRNSIYLGEVYNAGKEIESWNLTGFNDSEWKNAVQNDGPGGKPEKTFFPPVQLTGKCKPLKINSLPGSTIIVDMGINFTGLYKIRLKGNRGDTITFRFGERLYDDGTLNTMTAVAGQIKRIKPKGNVKNETTWNSAVFNTDNGPGCPPVAWQTDKYIFGTGSDVVYSPLFTFHVYRYMEISGLKYTPEPDDIEGLIFNSNVENSNSFSCSSELLNSIQKATRRTFLNNLISVQSDCPGRERFGYGGDLNATCDAFIYNFDMHSFYRKTVYDWVDAMKDSIFIDTAPFVGIRSCGLSWESGFLITQYKLLLYYNDTALIHELYAIDLKWMEKVAMLHPSGIVDKGLADHESLVKVPVKLIGTTHYLDCARIMKRFASIMNDKDNERKFEKLEADLKQSVFNMYWSRSVPDTINRQTLFSTLLYYDIVPDKEKKAAVDSLMKALKKAPSGHFTTGIFGTKYILDALSYSGKTATVFNVLNSRAYPGWGFMMDRGATTIWETWKESDNVYSNSHPMFGSVTEWFYRWLGGIQPDPENPGFRKFTISPFLPSDLLFVKSSYASPYGIIKSNWEKTGKGARFEISVPKNTSAVFIFPDQTKVFAECENADTRTVETLDLEKSGFRINLTEGNYSISY